MLRPEIEPETIFLMCESIKNFVWNIFIVTENIINFISAVNTNCNFGVFQHAHCDVLVFNISKNN